MKSFKVNSSTAGKEVDISFCIASFNKRELLLKCLSALFELDLSFSYEVIVVDDCSSDGSAEAAEQACGERVRILRQTQRSGKAVADSLLLDSAKGKYCLLLNDDSQVLPGAAELLADALDANPDAAAAGAKLLGSDGEAQPCAWRFPTVGSSLIGALTLGRLGLVQSKDGVVREVDWVQSAAMMVRKTAYQQVGPLDDQFFVYSDEVDWCKRAHDLGLKVFYVPSAEVIHHEQLGGDDFSENRIVEFCRNRDRYMRKHHGSLAALAVRLLTAWTYLLRSAFAVVMPGRNPKRYFLHVKQSLVPNRGVGLRELAEKIDL